MANYSLTNADIIKGGHLMVFLNDEPIAFATSHSLSKTMNTQEISTWRFFGRTPTKYHMGNYN